MPVFRFAAASLAVLAAVTASVASAQPTSQQKVIPPETRYWMGATTGSGMMAMMGAAGSGDLNMGDMMRMATGGMRASGQSVELRIGSSLSASGAPETAHTMPPGSQVNKPIQLAPPRPERPGGPGKPFEPPKGSIKFYWGCGERAGPGQPVTLTYDKLMRGENDPDLAALRTSVDAREVSKPTASTARTFADWPNGDERLNRGLRATFGDGASLAGPHAVKSNFGATINFTLPADKTFMAPLTYTSTAKQASGAIKLDWTSVPRATGYAFGVVAGRGNQQSGADMVMWSSANRPATFVANEDLSPAEVQRLIGLKAVLAPGVSTCTVPREVVESLANDRQGGAMLFATAFGDQFTQAFPERPADPKTTWDQDWFTRVNFKSARMDMLTRDGVQDMGAMIGGSMARGAQAPSQMSDADYCAMLAEQKRNKPSLGGAIGEATGLPGGAMLGRAIGGIGKKKQEEPVDPRCVKK